MRKLYGLQYLRALAAIAVALSHIGGKEGLPFEIGRFGVDLFFVMSGFLMVVITTPSSTLGPFLIDRILRVVPLYWIATTATILGVLTGLYTHMGLTPGYVVKSYFFIPAASPSSGAIWPVLIPGWTLNLELLFYILFAGLLAVPSRVAQIAVLSLTLVILVVINQAIQPDNILLKAYGYSIVLEFAAGAWLGIAWKRLAAVSMPAGLLLIILGTISAILFYRLGSAVPRGLGSGLSAVLIVAGMLTLEHEPGGIAYARLPALCGDASYSIYLWHGFAISAVSKIAHRLGLGSWPSAGLSIVASVLLGILIYRHLEQPLLRVFNRKRFRLHAPIADAV